MFTSLGLSRTSLIISDSSWRYLFEFSNKPSKIFFFSSSERSLDWRNKKVKSKIEWKHMNLPWQYPPDQSLRSSILALDRSAAKKCLFISFLNSFKLTSFSKYLNWFPSVKFVMNLNKSSVQHSWIKFWHEIYFVANIRFCNRKSGSGTPIPIVFFWELECFWKITKNHRINGRIVSIRKSILNERKYYPRKSAANTTSYDNLMSPFLSNKCGTVGGFCVHTLLRMVLSL